MSGLAIRVLVVDDSQPWRDFVRSTFQRQPELRMIGEAADSLEAIQKAEELQRHLVLLHIGLPGLMESMQLDEFGSVFQKPKYLF